MMRCMLHVITIITRSAGLRGQDSVASSSDLMPEHEEQRKDIDWAPRGGLTSNKSQEIIASVENSWQSCGSPAGNFIRDVHRPDQ